MRRLLAAAPLLLLAAAGLLLGLSQEDPFPHTDHAGLFPTCLGCHAGIPEGDATAFYSVTAEDCAACHDGQRGDHVEWGRPAAEATNLSFRHPEHREKVEAAGDEALSCGACHAVAGAERFMEVRRASAESCLGCHAHEAKAHLAASTACANCHVVLADAGALTPGRIKAFPGPEGHADPDFVLQHAEIARASDANCAFCHARESCARCHLNAVSVQSIVVLPTDARVAAIIEGLPGEWPEPADHEWSDWMTAHGAAAMDGIEACANCHARPSCAICHGEAGTFLAELPEPMARGPAGAVVAAVQPPGHTFTFAATHGIAAALSQPNCEACHLASECADCHALAGTGRPDEPSFPSARHEGLAGEQSPSGDQPPARGDTPPAPGEQPLAGQESQTSGVDREPSLRHELTEAPVSGEEPAVRDVPSAETAGGYHPVNFVMRHAAEAYAVRSDCTACHSTEVFCRTCHTNLGVGATGQRGTGAYHDAQPDWLLGHGKAARQGLAECATCHQQTSCLRCHSAKFGLRISPHGPDFDPQRVADRSTMSCGHCHFSDILDRQ